jgi:AcrR family transcriptional regulator
MSGLGLAFVLLERAESPDTAALVSAAQRLGLTLRPNPSDGDDGPSTYEIEGGGTLMVMVVNAPHPDAAGMPTGLASPDDDALARVKAHYIVTALELPEDARIRDTLLAALTAAVVRASPAIGAMLGSGVAFHRADFFAEIVEAAEGELPTLVCVDVTAAGEPDDRVSFLTHGLTRYGREEFFITASQRGKGAVDFLLDLVNWMLADPDKHLPTGETVGRTAEEKITIQRVPSPLGEGPEVIRLDLDT